MPVLVAALVGIAVLAAGTAAAPAPEGVIVFERRTGLATADVWSVRADGTALRRLTRTEGDFEPELSPDGRFVVFASRRTHRTAATELFVIRSDGTGVRRLTRNAYSRRAYTVDADPTWSPDGATVVFSRTFARTGRSSTDLFSVPAEGGPVRRLTYTAGRERSPTFSAAPFELGFVRDGVVWRRVGTGPIRTFAGADPDWTQAHQFPAWSRDGHVYRATLDGDERVGAGTDPAWSPDGRSLVWVTPNGLVVDGRPLTRSTRPVRHLSPSWGPAAG